MCLVLVRVRNIFRPMRILQVVTAFPRSADDAIVPWLVELIKLVEREGAQVEVFTSAYRGGGNREFRGIPVHRFRYFLARWENLTHDEAVPDRMRKSLLYKLLPGFYVAAGMIAIWRLCRRERYDIIHVHWPLPHALFGWVARQACGAKVVTSFHGVELRWVRHSLPFLRRFLTWSARSSARVVANSTETASEIRRIAPKVPVDVIPYSTGLAPALGAGPRPPAEADRFEALFVGRLVERKGTPVLVAAAALLPKESRIRVVIVGDGPDRPALEAQAAALGVADRVQFRGRVSAEELQRAYASAGAFILPAVIDSRGDTEGLGVVLLEAMSYRVPVVGSRIGGITDIIVDGESGLLVPPGDAEALAAAMRRLAEDPGYARRLGDAGHAHFERNFGWDRIVRRWMEVYGSMMPDAKQPTA